MFNVVYVFNGDPNPATHDIKHYASKPGLEIKYIAVRNFPAAFTHFNRNCAEIEQVFLSATAPDNAREFFGRVG